MVGDGEDLARASVEELESEFLFHREPALLPKDAVEVDGLVHGRDAVFGEQDDLHVALLEEEDELADEVVNEREVAGDIRVLRAEALEAVIEVREIDEVQRGLELILNPFRGLGYPARRAVGGSGGRLHACVRSPETGERKLAEVVLDALADVVRPGVNVEELAPVRRIHGARRDGPVGGGIHVIPPEKLRAGERVVVCAQLVPELAPVDEAVGLLPELHFGQLAIIPAVGDDAVLRGLGARDVVRLRGGGEGGKGGVDIDDRAALAERRDARGPIAQKGLGEADNIEHGGAVHRAAACQC